MAIKFLDETDIASSTKLGAVKIGNGISIAEDGTISSEGSGSASAVWPEGIPGRGSPCKNSRAV